MMLFLAYVFCSWLAGRLATREGIEKGVFNDLAIVLFVTGILGARICNVLQEPQNYFGEDRNPLRIFALWDGGLVLYGSILGGAVGYYLAHRWFLAPKGISAWKMADVLAPCIALGVCLGRVGCLMSGCCYGNVACASCPAITFPLPSHPTVEMARLGYQTLAGFTVYSEKLLVYAVEPGSPAAVAGLQPGDSIIKVNDQDVNVDKIQSALVGWPPGDHALKLTVRRGGNVVELEPFQPRSLPLHPTQLYETVSMALLVFLLLSYYPFKKHDGSVMVLLMLCYGAHRFLNEMLRIDNRLEFDGLTFSQNVSILVLIGAAVLAYFVFRRRPESEPAPPPSIQQVW
jgi:phosphatidylglycerol---prolipoprotein diacylglyceryl transferase